MNLLAPLAVVTAAVLLARRGTGSVFSLPTGVDTSSDSDPPPETDQTALSVDDIAVKLDPRNYLPANVAPDVAAANVRAGLDAIAWSEGTAGKGDDGYNILFGGGTFNSYDDHPRLYFPFTDKTGKVQNTSAAGRYQFVVPTWDSLVNKLGLPDFSPASQDAAALELIREKGAYNDLAGGRFPQFVDKVRRIWASLPGSGWNQGERPYPKLLAAYQAAGGNLESQA